MSKFWVFLVLIFIAISGYAQSDILKQLPKGMITYSKGGFFRPGKFIVDGKEISGSELKTMLIGYQPSAVEFNEFKKNDYLSLYSCGAAIAFIISSAIAANDYENVFKNTPSKILFGVGIGFMVPEVIFVGKRNRHFRRSVELYDRQFYKGN